MILDEAIKHCEEEAKEQRWQAEVWEKNSDYPNIVARCLACAEEHEQLAEWLTDYKRLLEEERPTGKWIVDYQENEDALFRHGWKCPVCETRNTYGMPPYCMYCGARLEKADVKL